MGLAVTVAKSPPSNASFDFCVCVPVKDEAERLPILLDALADQDVEGVVPVALAVNNTRDATPQVLEAAARRHAGRLRLIVREAWFPPELAHAGSARRLAMELGLAQLADDRGLLLSTDADARPPSSWIGANLRALAAGADVLGGRLVIDKAEPLAREVAEVHALWAAYWDAVRRIEDAVDPRPWDPQPRHGDHTGASVAIRARTYEAAGGVPLIASSEDCALVDAAVALGARLAHPMTVWTRVSPRYDGRAAGGMAQAMVDLQRAVEAGHEPRAPAFEHWRARAMWRRDVRRIEGVAAMMAQEARLDPPPCDSDLRALLRMDEAAEPAAA